MSKMGVYFVQGMSDVIYVEADTVDEAIEKASALADFQPCHQCNDSFEPDGDMEVLYVYGPDGSTVVDTREQAAKERRAALADELAEIASELDVMADREDLDTGDFHGFADELRHRADELRTREAA